MQLRVKALYGRTVSITISVLWGMEVVAVASLGIASLVSIDVRPVPAAGTLMCNPTYLPRFATLFWVPLIAFELLLFSLACRIAWQNYIDVGDWRGAALLHVVLRDNFVFFFCVFSAYLITAVTWIVASPRYFIVPGMLSCALTTTMGCRLVLNLCEAYHTMESCTIGTRPRSIWGATARAGAGEHRVRFARGHMRAHDSADMPGPTSDVPLATGGGSVGGFGRASHLESRNGEETS